MLNSYLGSCDSLYIDPICFYAFRCISGSRDCHDSSLQVSTHFEYDMLHRLLETGQTDDLDYWFDCILSDDIPHRYWVYYYNHHCDRLCIVKQ